MFEIISFFLNFVSLSEKNKFFDIHTKYYLYLNGVSYLIHNDIFFHINKDIRNNKIKYKIINSKN